MKTITNGTALDISRWLGKRVRAHSKLDGKIVEGVLCEEAEGFEGFFVLTNTWYMVAINRMQRIDLLDDVSEALAAPPDPWTHRPKDGWTAKTLPEAGERIVFAAWIADEKKVVTYVEPFEDNGIYLNRFRPENFLGWCPVSRIVPDCVRACAPEYTALDGAARDGE